MGYRGRMIRERLKKYKALDPEDLDKIFTYKKISKKRARFSLDGVEYFDFIQEGENEWEVIYKYKKNQLSITETNFELLGSTLFDYLDHNAYI